MDFEKDLKIICPRIKPLSSIPRAEVKVILASREFLFWHQTEGLKQNLKDPGLEGRSQSTLYANYASYSPRL